MAGGEGRKNSDLGVRTASAVVMVAVAGTALWLGGWVWTAFVAAVALGVLWEWRGLTAAFRGRTLWNLAGLVYVFVAAASLWRIRLDFGIFAAAMLVAVVAATDIGAYFAGRTIGGPKIAPAISPSKTWAGLAGGMVAAAGTVLAGIYGAGNGSVATAQAATYAALGAMLAVVAQAGDFFESWIKRRAGVKDSGALIPGHGGLFDRLDGLLAVLFAVELFISATVDPSLVAGGH